jgi:hypothetical protein
MSQDIKKGDSVYVPAGWHAIAYSTSDETKLFIQPLISESLFKWSTVETHLFLKRMLDLCDITVNAGFHKCISSFMQWISPKCSGPSKALVSVPVL